MVGVEGYGGVVNYGRLCRWAGGVGVVVRGGERGGGGGDDRWGLNTVQHQYSEQISSICRVTSC